MGDGLPLSAAAAPLPTASELPVILLPQAQQLLLYFRSQQQIFIIADCANPVLALAGLHVLRQRIQADMAAASERAAVSAPSTPGAEVVPPAAPDAAAGGLDAPCPWFYYYGQLPHQQNMLQDEVRTGTYRSAIIDNAADFEGAVVLDCGTGSGILALFAAQAGAKHVYAVDASNITHRTRKLVEANGYGDRITVIQGTVEEIELPEKVDIIVSEPMGFLLVHEQMLKSYMIARRRFLRPGGLMMPSRGTMYLAPFSDQALWDEQEAKVQWWNTTDFHGVDMTCLQEAAAADHYSQAVVGYFDASILLTEHPVQHTIDFGTDDPESLSDFEIQLDFVMTKAALLHGVAGWFDVEFNGSSARLRLDTSPWSAGTHWYQARMLLQTPIGVNAGQRVTGALRFRSNVKYSYDILMTLTLDGTTVTSSQRICLQDQYYSYAHT